LDIKYQTFILKIRANSNSAKLFPLNESKISVFGNLKYIAGAQD